MKSAKTAWRDTTSWTRADGSEAGEFPKNVDDVAIIPIYSGSKTVTVDGDLTVSEVHIGCIIDTYNPSVRLQGNNNGATLTFSRSSGKPALLHVSGGLSSEGNIFRFNFGGENNNGTLSTMMETGLELDCGYCGDVLSQRIYLNMAYQIMTIPEGETVRIINGNPRNAGANQANSGQFISGFRPRGAGVLWHNSGLNLVCYSDFSGFTGTLRESGFGHLGYDRASNMQMKTTSASNAVLSVEGYVKSDFGWSSSAGFMATGINGWGAPDWKDRNDLVNSREFIMRGGLLELRPEERTYTESDCSTNELELLSFGRGLSAISCPTRPSNTTNGVFVRSMRQLDNEYGTVYIQDARTYNNKESEHEFFQIDDFADHTIGGGGALGSECESIIPWMTTRCDSHGNIDFAAVDGLNRLIRHDRASIWMPNVTNSEQNVYNYFNLINLTTNITINSLKIRNENKDVRFTDLGAGRTLTITSGGLIFYHGVASKLGTPDTRETTSGTLIFPNTAYIWATSTSTSTPNEIWCPILAPEGLVCAYYGNLLLGGDQTGIDKAIVINNGTLLLGSTDGAIKTDIDVPVRIVGGNSKLKINAAETLARSNHLYFDDVAGFCGKIEIPAGQTEICGYLYVNDMNMPRGTYGATGSGAEIIDDNHFTGTGILDVRLDTLRSPTTVILR